MKQSSEFESMGGSPQTADQNDSIHFIWPRLPLFGIAFVMALGVLVLIYELSQVTLTQHVIYVDVNRQSLAGKVAKDVLECRRYEKDVFLNLNHPVEYNDYLLKWRTAWNKLSIDTEFLSKCMANEEQTRLQMLLHDSVKEYQKQFLNIVEKINREEIKTPQQANLAMTPFKDDMRNLSILSSKYAVESAKDATEHGGILVWRGGVSAIVILLLTIVPSVILLFLFRKYNQKLILANEKLQSSKNELKQSEAQFRTLMNNIPGVTFRSHVDESRTIEFVCETIKELLGYPAEELLQNKVRTFTSVIHPDDITKVHSVIQSAAEKPQSFQVGYRMIRADGEVRYVWEQGLVSHDHNNVPMVDSVMFDVTDRKQAELELRNSKEVFERASLVDKLTGLPNRTLSHERLKELILESQEKSEANYAVIFLDFDRFKMVNDSLGHDVGDLLLVEIATRLRRHLRCTDSISQQVSGNTAGRLGGDEFLILINNIKSLDEVNSVAERLLDELARPYFLEQHEVYSTASMGIVIGNKYYKRPEEIIRDADTAMYEAKRSGKSRYVIFDDSMRKRVIREMILENDLRKAIENQELVLYYQPIVSLETGTVCCVEALLRWYHPTLGLISPGEFIPIAEDSQQIIELGEWVLREGCRQYAEWSERLGYSAPSMISINLSRKQFICPNLVQMVESTLQEFNLDPKHLQLEVTEDAFASDVNEAIQAMKEIKNIGVKLAIDDFGVGCSSFASLNQFPVDTLKIDRSLVDQVIRTKGMAAMINSLVVLSENLGIMLISEGIEEQDQLTELTKLGCEYGQGFLFAKPLTSEVFEEYLLKQSGASIASTPQLVESN
ncbi:GGDEF domain-containing phosphodiesterase [Gimesia aquarii]|uniref:Phytochrome-like protein cph2 n=1 Tax=Gimesia aquarii TaxID=2527964 RepID=A0A517WZK2_9PLAN|nr:GGDEF domain-containing phosphodiesterase [Gimesia aquarii]QDU10686.1 Phytochrome-like protein cph2 [Gimesia aquarii]